MKRGLKMPKNKLSIRGRLARSLTPDKLELEGFLCEPEKETEPIVFLHLHGMFENYTLPLFIDSLTNHITQNGQNFLTVNTRAHDYFVYFRQWNAEHAFNWVQAGGSYEIFSKCLLDIEGWLNFCKNINKRVVLMGHSHGALKTAYYAAHNPDDPRIIGLILLSPSDDVGLQKQAIGNRYDEALQLAERMINDGHENDLMPGWAYGQPASAAMYVDMFSPGSDLAIFRFDEPSEGFTLLQQINVPTLSIFGSDDIATSTATSEKALELIHSSLSSSLMFNRIVIDSANHHYVGQEDALAQIIVNWANQTLW